MNLPEGFVLDAPEVQPNQPRGFRNMNPGNLVDSSFTRQLPGYQGNDGKFARFDSMENGQAAIDRLLQSYGARGFNTPASIINRWAPPSDNNPTNAYAANVARALGVDPTAQVDMNDPSVRRIIAEAIIQQENGQRLPQNAKPVSAQGPMQLQGYVPPEQPQNPMTVTIRQTPAEMQAQPRAQLPAGFKLDEPQAAQQPTIFNDPNAAWETREAPVQPDPNATQDQRWGWQKWLDDNGLQTAKDFSAGVMKGNVPFSDEIVAGMMTLPGVVKRAITGEDSGKSLTQRAADTYSDALAFNRKTDQEAYDRSPVANTLGQVAGAVNTAGTLAKGGVTLLNPANPTVKGMAARGAAEAGIYGGVYGFGEGEGLADRIHKGVLSAVLGVATGGVTGAIAGKTAQNTARKAIPTAEELAAQAKAAYQAAENAGVVFKPDKYTSAVADWFNKAANHSLDPTLTPNSVAAFKRLEELRGLPLSLQTMEQMRKILNVAAKQASQAGNKADGAIANATIRRLDEFVQNNANVLFAAGNPQEAARALREARSLWRMSAKSEQVTNLIESAYLRAQNYSQSGIDNALKTEFMSLARDPKKLRGFTEAEQAAIKRVVNGSLFEKAARGVGKFAVRGPVSAIPTVLSGVATGGVVGPAVTAAVGEIGKQTAGAMRMGNARFLDQLIRSGGQMPTAQITPAQRLILESIMVGQPTLFNRQQAPVR